MSLVRYSNGMAWLSSKWKYQTMIIWHAWLQMSFVFIWNSETGCFIPLQIVMSVDCIQTRYTAKMIKLNIGGEWFTTARSTLLSEENSLFQDMLSSNETFDHSDSDDHSQSGSGYFFIDRDGTLFRYILNYLRSGELICPQNFNEYEQLLKEAEFYRLDGLCTEIEARMHTKHVVHFVEVIEIAHPEKVGLCCARIVLTEALRQMPPFCGELAGENSEEVNGQRGRLWVRSSISRLDWAQILTKYGWKSCGSVAFIRKIPDITGYGTDMTHIMEKWMKSS